MPFTDSSACVSFSLFLLDDMTTWLHSIAFDNDLSGNAINHEIQFIQLGHQVLPRLMTKPKQMAATQNFLRLKCLQCCKSLLSSMSQEGRIKEVKPNTHHCSSQTSKLATISVRQHVQPTSAAAATSNAAATSSTAVGDVVLPVGSKQLGTQANKVAVAQASTTPKCQQ